MLEQELMSFTCDNEVTLSLLLYKILAYFRNVPLEHRPRLLHVLRKDGESYILLNRHKKFRYLGNVDEKLTRYIFC